MEYFENVHFTNPQIVSALVHLLCKTTIWNIYYIQSLYGEYTVTIKSTVRMCAFVKDDADHERNAGGEAEEDEARVLDT